MTRGEKRVALCGADYHPIRSCLECHRLDMRRRRAAAPPKSSRSFGFRGPECLECGGIKSEVRESGYTDAGQRIRRRVCHDCGQDCASVEVYVDPSQTSFYRLDGERMRRKRVQAYARRGKGLYRVQSRWTEADELDVRVRVIKHDRHEGAA